MAKSAEAVAKRNCLSMGKAQSEGKKPQAGGDFLPGVAIICLATLIVI
jgi:hypothetical protein